jgi:2-phosphoglycerate kinase
MKLESVAQAMAAIHTTTEAKLAELKSENAALKEEMKKMVDRDHLSRVVMEANAELAQERAHREILERVVKQMEARLVSTK